MRDRLHIVAAFLAAVTAAAWLASGPVAAQAPAAAAKKPAAAPSRTADGHPDFQGTYDVATMTPVERPSGVTKLVLTNQEAAAMEAYEAQRQVKNDAPLDPNRGAPPVGGDNPTPKTYLEFLELAGGGAGGGYNNFWL